MFAYNHIIEIRTSSRVKPVLYFVSVGVGVKLQYTQHSTNKGILPLNLNEWRQFRSSILLVLMTHNVPVNVNILWGLKFSALRL
jgi:hypothetical protein